MASTVDVKLTKEKEPGFWGSTCSLVLLTAVGAIIGMAVTIGVAYPTLKAQWEEDAIVRPNPCDGAKPKPGGGFDNHKCLVDGVIAAVEQAGANVTVGWTGSKNTTAVPVKTTLAAAGMCPVNVHWHLGAEHLSVGEYDETGTGPSHSYTARPTRKILAAAAGAPDTNYLGLRCKHYNANDVKFTKAYDFKYCKDMKVGETYEVHWPHSEMGACNTPDQYQTPFYDGVLCRLGKEAFPGKGAFGLGKVGDTNDVNGLPGQIGVQAQVFTIVNDEAYYYPDLMRGMIVDGSTKGAHITAYTGSTTGTSRNNEVCSKYGPITWHVDRKCHLISASSFDKMCMDMKSQLDDMSDDFHAHGARLPVMASLNANNQDHSTVSYNDPQ